MKWCHPRTIRSAAALGLAAWFSVSAIAASSKPNVTYAASGMFTSPPISGNDLFQLQGEPFAISIVANEALISKNHGAQWAIYSTLAMTGTVQSRMLPTPIAIANNLTNILLAAGNPNQDLIMIGSPVKVIGITLTIAANMVMPKGTITNDHILPFTAPVTLTPANATMTYSDGTTSTVLGINGTLTATVAGNAQTAEMHVTAAGPDAPAPYAEEAERLAAWWGKRA